MRDWPRTRAPKKLYISTRAKQVAAEHLSKRLGKESSLTDRFRDMWCSEQILMIEAKWLG